MSQERLVTLDVRQQMFAHKVRPSIVPSTGEDTNPLLTADRPPASDGQGITPAATDGPTKDDVKLSGDDKNSKSEAAEIVKEANTPQGQSYDPKVRSYSTEVLRDEESISSPTPSTVSESETFVVQGDEEQLLAGGHHVTGEGEPPAYSLTAGDSTPQPTVQKGILKKPATSAPEHVMGKNGGVVEDPLEMPDMLKKYYSDLDRGRMYPESPLSELAGTDTGILHGYPSHISELLMRAYIKLGRVPFTGQSRQLWLKTVVVFCMFLVLAGAIGMVVVITVRNVASTPTILEIDMEMWGDKVPISFNLPQLPYSERLRTLDTEESTSLSYQLIHHVDSLFQHSKSHKLKTSYGFSHLDHFSDTDGHVRATVTIVLQKHSDLADQQDSFLKELQESAPLWEFKSK